MADAINKKWERMGRRCPRPLLSLLVLFGDAKAAAGRVCIVPVRDERSPHTPVNAI